MFKPVPVAEKRTVAGLLETIGLVHKADVSAGLLSHGEKQWLEIGMLVAQSPDLLLVDEPVAGLTDEETALTGDLLVSLAANLRKLGNWASVCLIAQLVLGLATFRLHLQVEPLTVAHQAVGAALLGTLVAFSVFAWRDRVLSVN